FTLSIPRPPRPPLFPYTTLFRSLPRGPPHPPAPRRRSRPPGPRRVHLDRPAPPPRGRREDRRPPGRCPGRPFPERGNRPSRRGRSEEHTSELQSRENLVCRLLLE